MPSQFELYRVRGDELNDQFFNVRFRNIDARITALESAMFDMDAVADALVSRGLDILQARLNEAVKEISEQVAAVNELAQEIESQIQELEDTIGDIIGGGSLPAANITLEAVEGLEADDVQEAIEEIASLIAELSDLAGDVEQLAEALITKAPLASPNFSGAPKAPTPDSSDNSTRIATTAFVKSQIGSFVPTSREVKGGGLVSGGGDLNQNRTLTVTAAGASDVRTGTDNTKALTTKAVYDAAVFVPVSYSSNVTIDFNGGLNREITLEGSFVLENPLNAKPGQSGCIKINTNGSDRNITYGSAWKAEGGAINLSNTDTTDYLMFYVISPSIILYSIIRGPS